MKIIFFGSDDFASAHLSCLFKSDHEVCATVTQPDRPKGRGMKVIASPIKEFSESHNVPCLQPSDVRDQSFFEKLTSYEADLFVVIAYGRILPKNILEIPKLYSINVHGSLLPAYRGAAPINWAIINGETISGLTIIKMNEKMDAGEIIAQKKIKILPDDNAQDLRKLMMQEGPSFLTDTINQLSEKTKLIKQDESKVTVASKMNKVLGLIDWSKTAEDINNLIRGTQPWPGAYTEFKGKNLKVLNSIVKDFHSKQNSGTVISIDQDGALIATGEKCLLIKQVQYEGAKMMDAISFARGQRDFKEGMKL